MHDFCCIESVLDTSRNLLDRSEINNRFPNMLPTWLDYIKLRAETAKYLSFHSQINSTFSPAQTLPAFDYITLFLNKNQKGCKNFYKVLAMSDKYSTKI